MRHLKHRTTPQRQRGAVLAIGMLILIVMTLIGVTGMSTAGLELKMAGNLKDWHVAFQATEAALRDGETDIVTTGRIDGETGGGTAGGCNITGTAASRDGICGLDPNTIATQNVWQGVNWEANAAAAVKKFVVYGEKTKAVALTGVVAQPRYIIEPVKDTGKPGKTLLLNDNQSKTKTFRVTAAGNGSTADASGNGNASVLAQSTTVLP